MQYNNLNLIFYIFIALLLFFSKNRNINVVAYWILVVIIIALKPFGISPDDYEYVSRITSYFEIQIFTSKLIISEPIFYILSKLLKLFTNDYVLILKIIEILSATISIYFIRKLPKYKIALFFYYGVIMPVQVVVLARTGLAISFGIGYIIFSTKRERLKKYVLYIFSVLSHKQGIFIPLLDVYNKITIYSSKFYLYSISILTLTYLSYINVTAYLISTFIRVIDNPQLNYYKDLTDGITFNTVPGVGMRSWIILSAAMICSLNIAECRSNKYIQYGLSGVLLALSFLVFFSPIPVVSRRFFEFYMFSSIFLSQSKSSIVVSLLIIYSIVNYIIELYIYPLSNFYEIAF